MIDINLTPSVALVKSKREWLQSIDSPGIKEAIS